MADIHGLPSRPKGMLRVRVTLRIDARKRLRLKASVREAGYVKEFGPFHVQ